MRGSTIWVKQRRRAPCARNSHCCGSFWKSPISWLTIWKLCNIVASFSLLVDAYLVRERHGNMHMNWGQGSMTQMAQGACRSCSQSACKFTILVWSINMVYYFRRFLTMVYEWDVLGWCISTCCLLANWCLFLNWCLFITRCLLPRRASRIIKLTVNDVISRSRRST